MPQIPQSNLFVPHIGTPCRLESGEVVIEAMLDAVQEQPLARHPHAADDKRLPFTLLFRAAPECPYVDGTFTLKIEGMEDVPGIYLNRIMNIGSEPGAMFQAAFN